jgi:putative ABC transport system permease protein
MTCGTGFWHDAQAGTRSAADSLSTACGLVSRGYFTAMGIPVLAGRDFAGTDRLSSPRVVIVDRTFARRYFSNSDAVGQRILADGSNALATIVGIVGEVHHESLTSAPIPTVYALHAQSPGYITTMVVRSRGDAGAIGNAVVRAIHDADPLQAVSKVSTVEADVAKVLARPKLQACLVAAAALLSIALATVGVYGLVAHVIAQQRREFAIRAALGATRGWIAEQVLWQGGRLVLAGVTAGVVGAIAVGKLVSSYLFGITTGDPLTYLVAVAVTVAAAMVAVAVVARRAAHVDPSQALRSS